MMLIRKAYLTLAALLCFVFCLYPAIGQRASLPVVVEHQADQDRRIVALESLNLQRRLTAVETEVGEMTWQLRGMLGGISLLLAEAAFRLRKKAV